MSPSRPNDLSSRELLARIGLSEEAPMDLLDDEPLDDLRGDLGAALRERYALLMHRHVFAPGDLVTWKPGLKNKRTPRYDQPAVVIEVLETPVLDREDAAGSTYFREPLDLVLGVIWDSHPGRGELVTFHFDSRRFQTWSEEA
ncbi:hypothetical protein G3480_18270 [Thiorhodococcus mannitoliphagus]|uniref:Uncharacterized protein n=1 Tax=Thiorhodococcus mannitoliphagus TaxID=329406 RepID=A0A6P1DZP5_9GAMM|nr:hypothetical protein [Thiorhodococcus mannitoliphagus]NEX22226.1 hypothetical protein [Thiorhodococcus mannitoliphagus]